MDGAEWLLYLLASLIGLLAGVRWSRRIHGPDRPQLGDGKRAELEEFADKNGWEFYDTADLRYMDEIERALMLVGQAEGITAGDDPFGRSGVWEVLRMLARKSAGGNQIVLGCWSQGGFTAVIAALDTKSTVRTFTLEVVGWQSDIKVSGRPPEGLQFEELLCDLPNPLRLRLVNSQLLLRVPGALEPGLVELLIERLSSIEAMLPARPDLGPQR